MDKMKMLLVIAASIYITACGGSGSANEETVTDNEGQSSTQTAPAEQSTTDTTKLADNPMASSAAVEMFATYNLSVNPTQYQLKGDYRFLKVVDSGSNTLYLGQISDSVTFTLPLNVGVNAFPLKVELFSELKIDSVSYEVTYE